MLVSLRNKIGPVGADAGGKTTYLRIWLNLEENNSNKIALSGFLVNVGNIYVDEDLETQKEEGSAGWVKDRSQ